MKKLSTAYILLFFFLTNNSIYGQASDSQKSDTPVILEYIKEVITQSPDSSYFNILTLYNNSGDTINGSIKFSLPDNFRLVSFDNISYLLHPGEKKYIPLRISLPMSLTGGQTYVINSLFSGTGGINVNKSCYVKVPAKRSWDMVLSQEDIYLNRVRSSSGINIRLKNYGNINELVKLEVDCGKLLNITYQESGKKYRYIDIPPNSDTTIFYKLEYSNGLSPSEEAKLLKKWNESIVNVRASNSILSKSGKLYFRMLESYFQGHDNYESSPLGFDYQMVNMMSATPVRYNLSLFGTILLPSEREISYFASGRYFQLLPFNQQDLSLSTNTYFYASYKDPNFYVYAGDHVKSSPLTGVYGRGINASWQTSQHNISLSLGTGRFSPDNAGSIEYARNLKGGINISATIAAENNKSTGYNAFTGVIGGSYSFSDHHSAGIKLAVSGTNFSNILPDSLNVQKDTTVTGISWFSYYNMNYNNLHLRISNLNTLNNYTRNSNNDRWNINGDYKINERSEIRLRFDRYKLLQTRYPYRFFHNTSYAVHNIGRLSYGISPGRNIYFQTGPVLNVYSKRTVSAIDDGQDLYTSTDISLYNSIRFRLNEFSSVTPHVYLGLNGAEYIPAENEEEILNVKKRFSVRGGINLYHHDWRLSLYYSRKPSLQSYYQLKYDGPDLINSSLHIRPYYEKDLFDNKVKISTYASYIYSIPSERVIRNLNTSINLYADKGWNLYASNNIYSNTRNDNETGRITSSAFSLFFGCRKTFNIYQPRLKYYDLTLNFFHDRNGNMIMERDEMPVSDIMVQIKSKSQAGNKKISFMETNFVSDLDGQVRLEKIPEGSYELVFMPLKALKDIFLTEGFERDLVLRNNTSLDIPLAESYKVAGTVKLIRDINSSEGKIDPGGIRVSATSKEGDTYATLTDSRGNYTLSIPVAGIYTIKVYNVLGPGFTIEQDKFEVNLEVSKNIIIDFRFIEKKREINIKGGTYNFRFLNKTEK